MRALIVDEHPLLRDALKGILRQQFPGAEVWSVDSHKEACDAVRREPADLVVTDLLCCRAKDLVSLPELVACAAPGRVIVLGKCSGRVNAKRAQDAGVHGYVPATAEPTLVAAAVALVIAGGIYFPQLTQDDEGVLVEPGPSFLGRLSRRQREVLQGMRQGQTNKAIASALGISIGTVKLHVQAILRYAGARNRSEAVRFAAREANETG
jgi:DNA-binding NarL/FixJ family response regulator